MTDLLSDLRAACRTVAERATHVTINRGRIPEYARAIRTGTNAASPDPDVHLLGGPREELAAFWLTLDAVNFGSGWFPTLSKRRGRSGYFTIAAGIRERFATQGAWSPRDLASIEGRELAAVLGQDPDHELMHLFARSLRDLGTHVEAGHHASFAAVVDAARGSAESLIAMLARWESFADTSTYDRVEVPFLKRAQIVAADLHRAGVAEFLDLDRLTIFADNLVPHVLRTDGILEYDPALIARIDRSELIEHDSPEEIEIRACALHAVELIVAERGDVRAADLDLVLWQRGQGPDCKSLPRHRTRCTAY